MSRLTKAQLHAAREFYEAGDSYCQFIDQILKKRPRGMYGKLNRLLITVLTKSIDLPDIACNQFVEPIRAGIKKQTRQCEQLAKLTEKDWRTIFEDNKNPSYDDIRRYMIDDDLNDIYWDLKTGAKLFDLKTEKASRSAIWYWRFIYDAHTNYHILRALRTIHELLIKGRK